MELKPGMKIKDNDPRNTVHRWLKIIAVFPYEVTARAFDVGRLVRILKRRIYTDDKPRKSGYSVVED